MHQLISLQKYLLLQYYYRSINIILLMANQQSINVLHIPVQSRLSLLPDLLGRYGRSQIATNSAFPHIDSNLAMLYLLYSFLFLQWYRSSQSTFHFQPQIMSAHSTYISFEVLYTFSCIFTQLNLKCFCG